MKPGIHGVPQGPWAPGQTQPDAVPGRPASSARSAIPRYA